MISHDTLVCCRGESFIILSCHLKVRSQLSLQPHFRGVLRRSRATAARSSPSPTLRARLCLPSPSRNARAAVSPELSLSLDMHLCPNESFHIIFFCHELPQPGPPALLAEELVTRSELAPEVDARRPGPRPGRNSCYHQVIESEDYASSPIRPRMCSLFRVLGSPL